MADSEMLTYILYGILVIVLGIVGCFLAKQWATDNKNYQYYIGAGVGALVGVGIAFGIHSYNNSTPIY